MLAILMCLVAFSDTTLENGLKLHYQVSGKGAPLLLIGGLANRLDIWDDLAPLLENHCILYRFDNRGMGASGDLEGAYTLESMADDAAGLMAALQIEKYHVAGISLGSFAAQKVALKYPDRVDKLVLIASSAGGISHVPPDQEVLLFFQGMAMMDRPTRIEKSYFFALHPNFRETQPDQLAALIKKSLSYVPPPAVVQRQMFVGLTFNHAEAAAEINSTTLILHGEDDRIVPVENARRLHALMPNTTLKLLKQSGHICIIDQKQAAAQAIIHFLENNQ